MGLQRPTKYGVSTNIYRRQQLAHVDARRNASHFQLEREAPRTFFREMPTEVATPFDSRRATYATVPSPSHLTGPCSHTVRCSPPVGGDIWKLRLDGEGAPDSLPRDALPRVWERFSPDGRWVAYTSNESGTYEVYVEPFSAPGAKSLVSTGGGGGPIWARNRGELAYNTGRTLMVVPIRGGDVLIIGSPRALFESDNLGDVVGEL